MSKLFVFKLDRLSLIPLVKAIPLTSPNTVKDEILATRKISPILHFKKKKKNEFSLKASFY